MRKVKSFQIRLEAERLWLRNEFRLLGSDEIKDFVIQLELVEGKTHLTPIRYDIRHNHFHRDLINPQGNSVEKKKFAVQSLEEAVELSIDDLISNWKSLVTICGYNIPALNTKSLPEDTMQKAKEYLLNLIQHPEKINEVPSIVELTISDYGVGIDSVMVEKNNW